MLVLRSDVRPFSCIDTAQAVGERRARQLVQLGLHPLQRLCALHMYLSLKTLLFWTARIETDQVVARLSSGQLNLTSRAMAGTFAGPPHQARGLLGLDRETWTPNPLTAQSASCIAVSRPPCPGLDSDCPLPVSFSHISRSPTFLPLRVAGSHLSSQRRNAPGH